MAALLSDQIDRLNQRTRAIKAVASQTAHTDRPTPISRPFTHAVLNAQIGQLIRDVDSTELGLFTLSKRPSADVNTHEGHLKRVEFVGATPLKKQTARREEKVQELAPEVHAQSALKLLHRYRTVRPMPRASKQLSDIMNRLQGARERVSRLEQALKVQEKDQQQADPVLSGKSNLKSEEETIRQLHSRLEELNERKRELLARRAPKPKPAPAKVVKPRRPSSPLENKFLGTPGEASRTLKFSSNLLDEEVDFNGLNDASFSMPTPQKELLPVASSLNFSTSNASTGDIAIPSTPSFEEAEEAAPIAPPEPVQRIRQPSPIPSTPPRTTPAPEEEAGRPTPRSSKDGLRINAEVERITSKIAAVYGELLSHESGKKPTTAKETISSLRGVSSMTPILESPSQSSVTTANSHGPSAQEILTAYLLIEVLSSPGHAMPLNKLKDSLTTKAKTSGLTVGALGQNPTRILYGCVGKRLIKIDRSGGEQLVKFDC
ncbi:hypothetical protein D9611_000161 [Ephemerocybe angulata]|uniref:Uncharacterized protein n=1 Tax=Ephemerocybe angulata TaxID=980116 RepID=A0A8H5BM84_9AGAR|nr:hypothetical protein D9611_000161 [Tulosesus angulatus]